MSDWQPALDRGNVQRLKARCHRPGGNRSSRVAKRALRGAVQSGVAAAAFAGMFFFDISLLLEMFAAVAFGIILGTLWPDLLRDRARWAPKRTNEDITSALTRGHLSLRLS